MLLLNLLMSCWISWYDGSIWKSPQKTFRKGKSFGWMTGWIFCPSHLVSNSSQLSLAALWRVSWCLTKVLPVCSGKQNAFVPPRKAFSGALCSFCNVKLPSSCDKTATTAASTIFSLAAKPIYKLTADSSAQVFRDGLQPSPSPLSVS